MTHYQLALFVHILGVLGLFIAMSLGFASMLGLRRAHTIAQMREWTTLDPVLGILFPVAAVLILVSGLYMVHEVWGSGTNWSTLSLILLIVLAVSGALVNGRRLQAIHAGVAAAPEGAVPPEIVRQVRDPILWTSVQTGAALAVGIVYLMTLKPDLVGSLVALAIALVIGLASAQPMWRGGSAAALREDTAAR